MNTESRTYVVFQINLKDIHNEINKLGREEAMKKFPKYQAYMDSTMPGSKEEEYQRRAFAVPGAYQPVAKIKADSLEDAFRVGNIGPEENIVRIDSMHSVSVGDVILTPDMEWFMVAGMGFTQL